MATQSLRSHPTDSRGYRLLGQALLAEGQHSQAIELLEHALRLDNGSIESLTALASALIQVNDDERASSICLRAAVKCEQNQNLNLAIAWYEKAIELSKHPHSSLQAVGSLLIKKNRFADAINAFVRALVLDSSSANCHSELLTAITSTPDEKFPAQVDSVLIACFQRDDIDCKLLARASVRVLKSKTWFKSFKRLRTPLRPECLFNEHLLPLYTCPLLQCLLHESLIPDMEVEACLTLVRRGLLLAAWPKSLEPVLSKFRRGLIALAIHNQYLFAEEPEESKAIAEISNLLDTTLDGNEEDLSTYMAWFRCYCMYRPVQSLASSKSFDVLRSKLDRKHDHAIVEDLRNKQEEQRIKATIKTLTPIFDSTSINARHHYEMDPYPPWIIVTRRNYSSNQKLTALTTLHFCQPQKIAQPKNLLIAGCGTGVQVYHFAQIYADTSILAFDLSLSSLAYGQREMATFSFEHVQFLQGDILALAELNRRFDMIVCTGVLHHLANPLRGWKVLANLLEPGGVMNVALYNRRLRKFIRKAQKRIRCLGIDADNPAELRRMRHQQSILGSKHSKTFKSITESFDFYHLGACRDLLCPVEESCYDLEQIHGMLNRLSLRFVGFDSPRLNQMVANETTENHSRLLRFQDLDKRYPDYFGGLYHFWCERPVA